MKKCFTEKILLVDDNVESIDRVISSLGNDYDIIVSKNGQDVLNIASDEQPDIILLDIVMPLLDGCEICRNLKNNRRTKHIPVIFLTGIAGSQSKKTCFDAGAADYIVKPFETEELKARINNHIFLKKAQENLRNQKHLLEMKVEERTFELKEALKKMEFSSLEAILRLSRAAEYRDDDTGNHVFRVGLYSAEIGKALNMAENSVRKLLWAAPMHDVGKIGVPDRILQKPGKLDTEEWNIMKNHTLVGSKILEGSFSDIICTAQMLAMGHHEKWNGKGYPEGRHGEDIPLFCRIVAIADVFDALTTERPYKQAFSIEKSLNIIAEERGEHFDPQVVDAFFSIRNIVLDIREKYSDIRKIDSGLFWNIGTM